VKGVLSRLVMVIGGIVLALILIEIGLRIVPEAIWKGLISKNPTRFILYKTDKDIGWVHVPNARTTWQGTGEYNVFVQINSLGLRDREHTYEKPPGTFRILVLGDSFTEGIEVPLEQVFPVRLEECLDERVSREIEVINAGTSGYGLGDELLFFVHEGVKYRPDLVLVAVYAHNDVKDMVRDVDDNMIQSFGGYVFYLQDGHLNKRWLQWTDPDSKVPPLERFLRRHSAIYYIFEAPDSRVRREVDEFIDDWWPWSSSPPPAPIVSDLPPYAYEENLIIFASGFPDNPVVPQSMKELWELFKAAILEMQARAEADGAGLAVVIIPKDVQVHSARYDKWVSRYQKKFDSLDDISWDMGAPNKAIQGFLLEHNIPTLDLMPDFQSYHETHDALYFSEDIHFNEKGHQLASDLMCDWLIENELVPLAELGSPEPDVTGN
jgi:lysophospholipase L1-like esterase